MSEALQRLVSSTSETVARLVHRVSRLRSELQRKVRELIDQGLVFALEGSELRGSVVGIDGSSNIILSLWGLHVFAVLVTRILINMQSRSIDVEYPYSFVDVVEDPSGNLYREVVDEVMLASETAALSSIHGDVVVIDGPIIDPPREPHDMSLGIVRRVLGIDLGDYHAWRAKTIRRALERGKKVIGVVKRVRGSGEPLRYITDLSIVSSEELLATVLLNEARRELGCHDCTIATKPIPLRLDLASVYMGNGVNVMVSYVVFRGCNRVLRIEVARTAGSEPEVEEVLKVLDALTPYGSCLPLPVVLAHEKCRIGKDMAQLLRESVLSKIAISMSSESLKLVELSVGGHS